MKIQKILHFIKKCFFIFAKICDQLKQTPYLLEDINSDTGQVIIHCRNSRAYITTTLEEIISSPSIVKGLTSIHACWIGYYYAIVYSKKRRKTSSQNSREFSFSANLKNKRFKIISLEMRTQLLTYYDMKLNREYVEKITSIVQDQFVITNLDSMQSCYIGMQAGYAVIKNGEYIFNSNNHKPILKLV